MTNLPTQDPIELIAAAERRVVPTEVDGQPARMVVAVRTYPDATAADVWDALTNPERLPRWFLPVTGELQVGGHYQLVGNAGGVVQTCESPRLLEVTWEAMGAVSWLAVELTESATGTRFELRHTQLSDNDFWRQYGPGATGVGWELALTGLDLHLSAAPGSAESVLDAAAFEAWTLTAAGKAVTAGFAAGWAAADIAAGADRELATAAGSATARFYRGESETGADSGESGG